MWEARRAPGRIQALVGMQNLDEHRRRRKKWNRGISTSAVKGYEATLASRARQLVEELEKRAQRKDGTATGRLIRGEIVDLNMWLSYFA